MRCGFPWNMQYDSLSALGHRCPHMHVELVVSAQLDAFYVS